MVRPKSKVKRNPICATLKEALMGSVMQLGSGR